MYRTPVLSRKTEEAVSHAPKFFTLPMQLEIRDLEVKMC